jgi:NAD(P)-dependent dehydrogenase (short-subunit alcohol dehydrogenase family)
VRQRLSDKIALVTGATSGIGRAACVRLAQEGAIIIGTGRNLDEAERTKRAVLDVGGTFEFQSQDVTSEENWRALMAHIVAKYKRLDVAINSAGAFFAKPLPETTLEDFRWLWQVDVESTFLGTKYALSAMRDTGTAGSVVNISSLAGLIGLENCSAYCASKAAVVQISRQMGLEAARFPVKCRVNVVCPGVIWTEMITKSYGDSDAVRAFCMDGNALQTVGEADDIAGAIAYLAGPSSRYVTASVLVIDGGRGAD